MVIIEGTAFPLDKLNENGWGVPASEADNAISSLKNAVIRVCPRDSPHGCDLSEDPKSEIGRVLDAWREGNLIKTRAEITDTIAERKILDRVWEPTWSVYGIANDSKDGWVSGFSARAMTLVRDPAWKDATFDVAASRGYLVFSSAYAIINTPTGDETMTNDETTSKDAEIKTLKEELAAASAKIGELSKSLESAQIAAASAIPADKNTEMVNTRAKEIAAEMVAAQEEDRKKTEAIQKYASVATKLGMYVDNTMFKSMTASAVAKAAENLELAASGSSRMFSFNPTYPANEDNDRKLTVGRYNSMTKKWEDS
jgi:hypothetical protein